MPEGTPVTRSRRARRRHRGIVWWLLLPLLFAAGVYAAAEVYAAPLIDGAIAQSVGSQLHGRASVSLQPGPVWQLLNGNFASLTIAMPHLSYQGLEVTNARLVWRKGQVRLQPLLQKGQVDILREGSLRVSGSIPAKFIERTLSDAVRPYIPSGSIATLPDLSIGPQGILLDGDVVVLGVRVPYRLEGVLTIASGGRSVAFETVSLNGSKLSLPAIPVLHAAQLPRVDGIAWRFSSVRLEPGDIYVSLRNAP